MARGGVPAGSLVGDVPTMALAGAPAGSALRGDPPARALAGMPPGSPVPGNDATVLAGAPAGRPFLGIGTMALEGTPGERAFLGNGIMAEDGVPAGRLCGGNSMMLLEGVPPGSTVIGDATMALEGAPATAWEAVSWAGSAAASAAINTKAPSRISPFLGGFAWWHDGWFFMTRPVFLASKEPGTDERDPWDARDAWRKSCPPIHCGFLGTIRRVWWLVSPEYMLPVLVFAIS